MSKIKYYTDASQVYFEAEGEQPMIKFIKLTGAEDKTDIYVNVNKINAISSQTENVRAIIIGENFLMVLETVEEILEKIKKIK